MLIWDPLARSVKNFMKNMAPRENVTQAFDFCKEKNEPQLLYEKDTSKFLQN